MPSLIPLLQLGAAIQFAILIASALTPRALDWPTVLAPLPCLIRRLFWVYGAFIVLVIVAFGILSAAFAPELAGGEPLGRALSTFIAVFWAARLGVQAFVFDARPYLNRPLYRIGYHLLTVAFAALTLIFGAAALFPAFFPLP